jgi:hypothetical protein
MRRLDVHPLKKLRNPARHLRSLRRWAEGGVLTHLAGRRQLEEWPDDYALLRPPFTSKLVAPRHTTPDICRAVAQSLLDAAGALSAGLKLERPVRVTCRLEPEYLWDSTLYLIFDDAYFQVSAPPQPFATTTTENYEATTAPVDIDLVADWALTLPDGFADFGGYRMIEKTVDFTRAGHHWFIAERVQRSHP